MFLIRLLHNYKGSFCFLTHSGMIRLKIKAARKIDYVWGSLVRLTSSLTVRRETIAINLLAIPFIVIIPNSPYPPPHLFTSLSLQSRTSILPKFPFLSSAYFSYPNNLNMGSNPHYFSTSLALPSVVLATFNTLFSVFQSAAAVSCSTWRPRATVPSARCKSTRPSRTST